MRREIDLDELWNRNTWVVDDKTIHYCPICDTLEYCDEAYCEFSASSGVHLGECFRKLLVMQGEIYPKKSS